MRKKKNTRRNIRIKVDDTRSNEYHRLYMRRYNAKIHKRRVTPRGSYKIAKKA